jgi:hydrogenase small subunit
VWQRGRHSCDRHLCLFRRAPGRGSEPDRCDERGLGGTGRRPLFAYGKLIHDACERRAHYDAGQYVEEWGDDGHRRGYCLYKVGCKGPVTYQNCPNVGWNEGTNWPIGCGHPCIGCAEPSFWDRMTPFYEHLPEVPGTGPQRSLDQLGLWATAGVAAAFATHTLVHAARRAMRSGSDENDESGTEGSA